MRARSIVLGAAVALACAAGCKRSPAPSNANDAGGSGATPQPNGGAGANGATNGGDNAAPAASDPGDLVVGEGHAVVPPDFDAAVSTITLGSGSTVTPGAVAPPPPVDPFEDAIAGAKGQAVGCFAPLPAGDYAVTLTVAVSPAGRATRVETSSGSVTDASVLACIRGVGESKSWPSSANGRSLSIDVRVSAK
jgi:hypothetical protein